MKTFVFLPGFCAVELWIWYVLISFVLFLMYREKILWYKMGKNLKPRKILNCVCCFSVTWRSHGRKSHCIHSSSSIMWKKKSLHTQPFLVHCLDEVEKFCWVCILLYIKVNTIFGNVFGKSSRPSGGILGIVVVIGNILLASLRLEFHLLCWF